MPRRNRPRRRPARVTQPPESAPVARPHTQKLAADLVNRGLASPQILGTRPYVQRTPETTD